MSEFRKGKRKKAVVRRRRREESKQCEEAGMRSEGEGTPGAGTQTDESKQQRY